jgi:hypothetical protein
MGHLWLNGTFGDGDEADSTTPYRAAADALASLGVRSLICSSAHPPSASYHVS